MRDIHYMGKGHGVFEVHEKKNLQMINTCFDRLDAIEGCRLGDFVRLGDGTLLRVTHVWDDVMGDVIQTYGGGSFCVSEHGISHSGSLYSGIPKEFFTLTDEVMLGEIWVFDNDLWGAGRAVHYSVTFRVYECAEYFKGKWGPEKKQ